MLLFISNSGLAAAMFGGDGRPSEAGWGRNSVASTGENLRMLNVVPGGTLGIMSALSADRNGLPNRVGNWPSVSYQFAVASVEPEVEPRRLWATRLKKF